MAQKILILGGGFGGMFAARELRKRLGDRAEIEIINNTNYFVFQPLLPEVGAGSITAMHAVSPLRKLLRGVRVRKARISSVDTDRKVVTVFQGVQRRPTEVTYDHLVVALGQGVDLTRTPGLADHALTMKTLDDARRLRAHVLERLEHADITALPEVKREALTFCIVGAGFSGIETAGELGEMIDRALGDYPNIKRSEIRIVLIEFMGRVLAELPETLATYAQKTLEDRGFEVMLNTGVKSATGTSLETTTGEIIGTRTIVATIGNTPSPVVQEMPLETRHGRIAVNRFLQAQGAENVWSLGDCALIPMKEDATERGDFAPPTAQFAVREARCLAQNIEAAIACRPLQPFEYTSQGALASLGAHRGVAEVWGMTFRGYPAWLLWRAYYLSFLPGFRTRITVLLNWFIDGFSRSTVQIRAEETGGARYVHYRAGDRVFEAGNRSDGVYSVISGAVELRIADPGTGEERVSRIGPGEIFGDRVIFGKMQRTGTVRALEDTQVLVLRREEVAKIATGFAPFRDYFQRHMKEAYGVDWNPEDGIGPDR